MSDPIEVSVIIPTLRADRDLTRALDSLASDKGAPSHEVLVVFNTPQPSDIKIEAHHTRARAIQSLTNLGFAAACNLGAREAAGKTLAFMNDDMTIQAGWLATLLSTMEEQSCRAAGGRILSEDGKRFDFDGGSVNLLGWGFQSGHGDLFDKEEFIAHQWLPFACGGNFAIDSCLFEKSGGFDNEYFAFYEDVDLGWRLRLMGDEIAFSPCAVTLHAPGSTGSLLPAPLKWFLQERNSLMTIIKNYSDQVLWRVLPIAFGLVAVRAQVLSGLDLEDVVHDRTWRDWVLGVKSSGIQMETSEPWLGLLDSMKESLKTGMKSARKASVPSGYIPMEVRGLAGLSALEWCLDNWSELMSKRAKIQSMRTKGDKEILPLFDDPMRPVLGHPREIEAMQPLEAVLTELLS
jgi:GT2 family glycosyltransferase